MKKHIILFLSIVVLNFVGCSGDEPIVDDKPGINNKPSVIKGLTVTPDAFQTISSDGKTLDIKIKSEFDWTAKVDQGWCKLSENSGKKGENIIKLTVEPNETYDERNTQFQIIADTIVKNLTITQKQLNALLVSSKKVEIPAKGGKFEIEVKANVNYEIVIPDSCEWLSLDDGSRGLEMREVSFKVKKNTDIYNRSTSILFKSDGLTEKVMVYQEGEEPSLVLTSNDFVVPAAGDTIKIELKSNCSYSYKLPEVDWIVEEESRVVSSYTHEFIISPNDTYEERSAIITFINDITKTEYPITITQVSEEAFVLAKTDYHVKSSSHYLDLRFLASVEFSISVDVDWVKINSSKALDNKYLRLSIDSNPIESTRTAHVYLKGPGNNQQVITIKQAAFQSYVKLVVTHNQEVFDIPDWSTNSSYSECWGMVDWGDGTNETWYPELFYKYQNNKQYSVTMDMYNGYSYNIEKIGSISSIVVYVKSIGEDSNSENMNVNNRDWDK